MMDPFIVFKYFNAVFQLWFKYVGPKWTWRLFGAGGVLGVLLILADSCG